MTAGVQVFVYPEELDAVSPDELAEQVLELGCDAASVAVVYHRARRVLPRQGRVSVLGETTLYVEPERGRYGALVPAAVAPEDLRRRLLAFREACDRSGLRFRAWVVALHHERLAETHPEAASRLLDGSPAGLGLCPSAPEAVELVAALVANTCGQLGPDAVDLEAALYPAWEPSYTLTLALEPPAASTRLLATQCFCPACRRLLGAAATELERRTRAAASRPPGAGVEDEALATELASARASGAARLIEAAAAAAHDQGSTLRVFGSGPPEQAALQGLAARSVAAADALLLGCGALAGDELVARFEGLRRLVGDRPATASTNWTPERGATGLAADAGRLAAAGADGLALYNLSLVPSEGLDAFRAAAAAFHAATRTTA